MSNDLHKDPRVRVCRGPFNRAAVVLLVVGLACHPSHYQAVTLPRCDGDNTLLVSNASNSAVDVYFSAARSKKSQLLGLADVGETELPMPPMYTMQGYQFEARRHSDKGKSLGSSVGPTVVRFQVVCHPR
jgi:hypothetical protein